MDGWSAALYKTRMGRSPRRLSRASTTYQRELELRTRSACCVRVRSSPAPNIGSSGRLSGPRHPLLLSGTGSVKTGGKRWRCRQDSSFGSPTKSRTRISQTRCRRGLFSGSARRALPAGRAKATLRTQARRESDARRRDPIHMVRSASSRSCVVANSSRTFGSINSSANSS